MEVYKTDFYRYITYDLTDDTSVDIENDYNENTKSGTIKYTLSKVVNSLDGEENKENDLKTVYIFHYVVYELNSDFDYTGSAQNFLVKYDGLYKLLMKELRFMFMLVLNHQVHLIITLADGTVEVLFQVIKIKMVEPVVELQTLD